MREVEKRYSQGKVELRSADPVEGQPGGTVLTGYAACYSSPSENLGGFVEVLAPGCFDRSLGDGTDIRALYNHDTSHLLGRQSSGTLRLSSDSTGLRFELDLPDTQCARDLTALVSRGDITGCSFGFCVVTDSVELPEGADVPIRTITDLDLIEITCGTAFPAYPASSVSIRSVLDRVRQPEPKRTPRLDRAKRILALQ